VTSILENEKYEVENIIIFYQKLMYKKGDAYLSSWWYTA